MIGVIMELKERLKLARKNAKKSQKDVADSVGITQPTLSQLENGLITSSTFLPAIARYLNVDPYWLETGKGEMLNKGDETEESEFSNVKINGRKLYKIPVLDFVQAGLFHETCYDGINAKGETYTTYETPRPKDVFSVEVDGMSMAPEFMPGDELVIDAALVPKPGSYVIAQNGGNESTFKKYRVTGYDEFGRDEFELIPLNPDFPKLSSKDHNIRIIGVLVQHLRRYKY